MATSNKTYFQHPNGLKGICLEATFGVNKSKLYQIKKKIMDGKVELPDIKDSSWIIGYVLNDGSVVWDLLLKNTK